MARLSLLLCALAFGGFGLTFTVYPELLGTVDFLPRSPSAFVEARAFYGGLELGLGAFFVAASMRPAWYLPALVAQVLSLGGVALVRLGAMAVHGSTEPLLFLLAGLEGAGAAVGLIALRTLPRKGGPSSEAAVLSSPRR